MVRALVRLGKEKRGLSKWDSDMVGKGDRVSFWKGIYAGEIPLMEVFPRLYREALNRKALVNENYNETNGVPQWSITFRRTLRDFEEDLHQTLVRLLGDTQMWPEEEDKWIWSKDPLRTFVVKYIL